MYAIEASPQLISTVTDAVLEEVGRWQSRPLDPLYALVFFDAPCDVLAHAGESGSADLLLIDDFAITPLTDQSKRDLLGILDDRYDKPATVVTSQLDVKQWHAYLDDPTLADAILDRVVQNAYHLDLSGDSVRKLRSMRAKNAKAGSTRADGSPSIAAPELL